MSIRDVLDTPDDQRCPEDLDGLLRAFFRAELREPWPGWQLPLEPAPRPMTTGPRTLDRSRWALAASLLCLAAGSMYLSGRAPESGPFGDAAETRMEAARRQPGSKPKVPRSSPTPGESKTPIEDQDELPR